MCGGGGGSSQPPEPLSGSATAEGCERGTICPQMRMKAAAIMPVNDTRIDWRNWTSTDTAKNLPS